MSKGRILVVDDEPQDCDAVKEYLVSRGFEVVVADNAAEAKRLMATDGIDVAVIDLRLERPHDEQDFSGITLAKQSEPSVPKIIWTGHPTVNAVREALGPAAFNGLPAAVGFVSKLDDEGPSALLNAIRLAMTSPDGALTRKILGAFEAEAPVQLHHRVREIGPEVASTRVQHLLADMQKELERRREQESREAARLHTNGVVVSWVGIAAIIVTLALLWFGDTRLGLLSAAVTAVTTVIQRLFSSKEKAAQERVRQSHKKLEDIYRATHLFAICEALESRNARDAYRKKLIDHMIDQKWLFNEDEDEGEK